MRPAVTQMGRGAHMASTPPTVAKLPHREEKQTRADGGTEFPEGRREQGPARAADRGLLAQPRHLGRSSTFLLIMLFSQ